ncbi:S1 family peptidase [Streptomyces sp. NPDC049099]|uniref:S1 family peptidase n=1 Tax=Streptomyces sp. NPDC049099 TaxID=3155768 RepID=UPI00341E88B1
MPSAAAAGTPVRGAAQLARVSDNIARAGVDGVSWYVDQASRHVVVTADSTVTKAAIARVEKAAGGDPGAVQVRHADGVFRPLLSAGDAIYGGQYRCSLGFDVASGSTHYFLTAGYDNTALSHPGGYTAANAYVGENVKRTGSTSGTHGGTVTALNVSVRYQGGGTVSGMIQTTVCAEPGDSGGPLYDGTKALGITSGGCGAAPPAARRSTRRPPRHSAHTA